MATRTLTRHEAAALVVAAALHAALIWWLAVYQPAPEPLPPPQAIAVTLSDEIGLTSTSPTPNADQPAAAAAPELGDAPPEPARLEPTPIPRPQPRAPERVVPKPPVKAGPVPPRPIPTGRPGAPRVDRDFLKGVSGGSGESQSALVPASQIGTQVKSSLIGAIAREIKPRWVAPQGAEVENLVTFVTFSLNPDGSLAGISSVRTTGQTDANRAQVGRHQEQARRAIQLAAPFNLPSEYYNAWKRVVDFRFDRRLSQ
ncbi:MAG: energy transducer TonB [Novosphingobium sp.]